MRLFEIAIVGAIFMFYSIIATSHCAEQINFLERYQVYITEQIILLEIDCWAELGIILEQGNVVVDVLLHTGFVELFHFL